MKNSSEMVLSVQCPSFPPLLNSSNLYFLDSNLEFGGGNFYYHQL